MTHGYRKGGGIIDIIVKHNSRENIYEQIVNQIKLLIANEKLQVGDSIPSIRKMSQELGVSLISVQRAYDELQKEGIVESIQGKGCFISSKVDKSFLKDSLLREVEEVVQNAINISKQNNISLEEFILLVKEIWGDD